MDKQINELLFFLILFCFLESLPLLGSFWKFNNLIVHGTLRCHAALGSPSRLVLGLIDLPSAALCSAVLTRAGVVRASAQASASPQRYVTVLPNLRKGGPSPRTALLASPPADTG